MINREVPVIVVNGILEAGKTHFLNEALEEQLFIDAEATGLILQCEEGIEEYDKRILKKNHTALVNIDSQEEFDSIAEKSILEYDPDIVYLEHNAMWDGFKLPSYMSVVQTITVVDASTFRRYFNNMRQKFYDLLTPSNVVIMFNCEDEKEVSSLKRNMKLINKDLEFLYFAPDGTQLSLADDLPYSVEGDTIEIEDQYYGIWFIDTMDSPARYNKKKVRFTAQLQLHRNLPKNFFLAGRKCMTCCANDIQDFYSICDNSYAKANIKSGEWAQIYGTILYRRGAQGEDMPYIKVALVTPCPKPENEVIGLS